MFARRVRKLERAADRIASGRFDEPVHDSGGGELRRLADAFERMRVRLAQLDDARREFVANASHELRTPLFSLGGFLELLDDEELDEPTRRSFLASMREQVDRLTKLASDLLDLTRLDAGRLTVDREPVDLAALAEEVAEEFRPVAQGTEHSLEVAPPSRSRRTPTSCAPSRSGGFWSRFPSCTPRRAQWSGCGRSCARGVRFWRSRTTVPRSPPSAAISSSSASTGSRARERPAAG